MDRWHSIVYSHASLVVTFVELIAPHTSVLTILAISFERYYAICQPLRAGYVCTKSRAMAISLFTWLCAGILTRKRHWQKSYMGSDLNISSDFEAAVTPEPRFS
ncbi:hypothetical protein OUZ56_018930 [Daphnia magna]|uniref:G-protein coupled receptors family 1 profile domain-containing protein n=1 Tax=Daphnia magna TaxID=35525 RepID=A0ABQ9ZA64_9CRUS|nr:hypothetical protein OUZ56_018930 [Daphnia magna]